jgi:hypothetical protein
MYGVGEITGHKPEFMTPAHAANMGGHALVGCASAVMGGGKCGPGALSGAAGSFASPLLRTLNVQHNVVAHAVVGGLASVAAGGNFANGAVTAAFGYLFNWFGSNWHEYGPYRSRICSTSNNASCSASTVFDGLLQNAYPGQPEGTIVQNGEPGMVVGGNPIRTYVDPDSLSITNVTEEAHSFCCGYVSRSVVQDGTDIYIETYGTGSNKNLFWAGTNWGAGYVGFLPSDAAIRRYVGWTAKSQCLAGPC